MASKAKRKTIAQTESIPSEAPPKDLLDAIAKDPGTEAKFDPDEAIWTGGASRINLDELLGSDLGTETALDQILLAVIHARPDAQVSRRGGTPKKKDPAQYRLEQARRYLIGLRPPRGQVPKKYEAELDRVARRYFRAAMGVEDHEATLRQMVVEEATSLEQREGLDHKQVDDLIRGHLRKFKKHKDRLLVKASASGLPEVDERTRKIGLVIRLLADLGIVPARKG